MVTTVDDQALRRLLAPVLDEDDMYDLVKLGRIQEDVLSHRAIPAAEAAAYRYLCENGGGRILQAAGRALRAHMEEQIRQNGGTIVTTTSRNGRTATTHRTYPAPRTARTAPRARSCSRTARPRERRSSASSSTSSADPGSDSDPPPPAPLNAPLAPRGAAHRVAMSWLRAGSMLVEREESGR